MEATWRDDRPVAMTSASASDDRPPSGIVTMSSALSSSSDRRMRSSSASSASYKGWIAAFFMAAFLEIGFLAADFLAAGLAVFGLAGALFARRVLTVSALSSGAQWLRDNRNLSCGLDSHKALGGADRGRALRIAPAVDDRDRGRFRAAQVATRHLAEAPDRLGIEHRHQGSRPLDNGNGNAARQIGA